MVAPTNEIPLNTVGATIGRPHKINGENKTIRRRTDPHAHCRDRASGQQVASLSIKNGENKQNGGDRKKFKMR